MSTRAEYQSSTWYGDAGGQRFEAGSQSTSGQDITSATANALGSMTQSAVDVMVRWPLQMTAAGLQWMTSGMQRMGSGMTGSGGQNQSWSSGQGQQGGSSSWGSGSGSNWGSGSSNQPTSGVQAGSGDQDLSGPDLKYVVWSIVFTKPGYEAVLEPMQSDMVNYSTDGTTFAAMKIAKLLERARHGKVDRPGGWSEHGYPAEPAAAARRTESTSVKVEAGASGSSSSSEKGWRIPTDDQKYVQFLYRVEWRLPKQEPEVTRVERVTVERTSNSGPTNIVV